MTSSECVIVIVIVIVVPARVREHIHASWLSSNFVVSFLVDCILRRSSMDADHAIHVIHVY